MWTPQLSLVELSKRSCTRLGVRNSSNSALAMRTGKNFRRSQKVCTNPTCPHKVGHLLSDCHGPGGPMEGRRDEVNAKIAKAREEREKKDKTTVTTSAPGVRHDKSGCAY